MRGEGSNVTFEGASSDLTAASLFMDVHIHKKKRVPLVSTASTARDLLN